MCKSHNQWYNLGFAFLFGTKYKEEVLQLFLVQSSTYVICYIINKSWIFSLIFLGLFCSQCIHKKYWLNHKEVKIN